MHGRLICIFVVFICVFSGNAPGQKPDSEVESTVKVIRGLRDRRLFELADKFSKEQLKSANIAEPDKALIVLEEIQTQVSKAIATTGQTRNSAWIQAEKIAADFSRNNFNHPKLLLVQVQDALTHASRGSLIQQEIEVEIATKNNAAQALEQFRSATQKLTRVEKAIEQRIPKAASVSGDSGELTQTDLVNLKNNVRYRLAKTNLAKAQLFDPQDRLNRIDTLNQVLSRLDEVVTQSNSDLPLWWDAHVSKARCLRLMQKPRQFSELIDSLPKKELTSELLTERVLAALDFDWTEKWLKLRQLFSQINKPTPHLQLAFLKMVMSQASRSKESDRSKFQTQATDLVKQIENDHGPYWGRRAEILLIGSVSPNSGDAVAASDFEILIRQGDSAFRKSNFADAVKAYTKAANFAVQQNRAKQALAVSVRLAKSHEKLKQHEQAAQQLFQVANRFRNEDLSAAVHLRGCWNLATAGLDQELVAALQNQIALWPVSTNTDNARLWLGNALFKQRQWEAAIEAYLSIPWESDHMTAALSQSKSCVNQWSSQVLANGGNWESENQTLRELLREKWAPSDQYNELKQQWMLILVQTGLASNAMTAQSAISFLDFITTESNHEPLPKLRIWRIVALAKNSVDAIELTDQIKELPNDHVLMKELLLGLQQCLSKRQQVEISAAIRVICDKAVVAGKTKDVKFWRIENAIAEAQTDGSSSGTEALATLVEKYPKSMRIQLEFARVLTKTNDAKAIGQWRRLAKKVKKESDAWYEAKYNVVQLMIASGQKAEAIQLVKYLEATTSNWKESTWKRKFSQLIR